VTTLVDEPLDTGPIASQPLVVPIGTTDPQAGASDDYYRDVLMQMRSELANGDLDALLRLLAVHDRTDAPLWVQEQIQGMRIGSRGLWFRREVLRHGEFRLDETKPTPIGATLALGLVLHGRRDTPIVLGGPDSEAPANFLLSLEIEDVDAFGSSLVRRESDILRPRSDVRLHEDALVLTFELTVPPGSACVRIVQVTAEMLPGQVRIEGELVPTQRAKCATRRIVQYPVGADAVAAAPLAQLREALAAGTDNFFPHVHLAARFLAERSPDDADRATAIDLLVQSVRLGSAPQARAAGAALRVLTGEPIDAIARDRWLEWSSRRGR
jgi:hypothetical protein